MAGCPSTWWPRDRTRRAAAVAVAGRRDAQIILAAGRGASRAGGPGRARGGRMFRAAPAAGGSMSGVFDELFPRGASLQRHFLRLADGRVLSYQLALEQSAQLAHALRGLGVRAGDRVAVQVEKSPEAVLLYLATLRAGRGLSAAQHRLHVGRARILSRRCRAGAVRLRARACRRARAAGAAARRACSGNARRGGRGLAAGRCPRSPDRVRDRDACRR